MRHQVRHQPSVRFKKAQIDLADLTSQTDLDSFLYYSKPLYFLCKLKTSPDIEYGACMENTIEQFEPKHNDVFDLWAIVSVRGRGAILVSVLHV